MKVYNIPFSPPDITEEEIVEVVDTLRSGWITTGPKTKKLEQQLSEYTHTTRTVCLNSATAGLELVLRVLGVGEGDEVIVPAMTYTASCSVIEHVGATPVIVDIQKNGFEMDYELLESKITEKTKVIIPVELAGIPCDYDKIFEVVLQSKDKFIATTPLQERFNRIVVLSDSAHAFGASYQGVPVGAVADFTVFSFHAVKNLTTAEGGAVTWKQQEGVDDDALYKLFQMYSLHGQTKDALAKTQLGAWEYDIVMPGYKCNMTDIMASIGLVQLKRYESLLNRRQEIVEMYDKGFEGSRIRPLSHFSNRYQSSYHLYIVHVDGVSQDERNGIIERMAQKGIACNVHYKPLPMLSAYMNMGFQMTDYPNAMKYFENTLTLPLHTQLTNEEVAHIIQTLKEIVK